MIRSFKKYKPRPVTVESRHCVTVCFMCTEWCVVLFAQRYQLLALNETLHICLFLCQRAFIWGCLSEHRSLKASSLSHKADCSQKGAMIHKTLSFMLRPVLSTVICGPWSVSLSICLPQCPPSLTIHLCLCLSWPKQFPLSFLCVYWSMIDHDCYVFFLSLLLWNIICMDLYI